MEVAVFTLDDTFELFCVTATSFPEGAKPAHEALHRMVQETMPFQRKYFGLSCYDGKGGLIYKAGTTAIVPGDMDAFHLERILVPAGEYYFIDIEGYMKNIAAIGQAFKALEKKVEITPENMAVEWYLDMERVRCMVRKED